MSEAVDRILSKLERVRQSGQGWIARCPAHNDRDPSLKIDEGDDGRELVKCHAGCFQEDIVQALGLTMPDLFERRNGGGEWTTLLSRMVRTLEHLAKKAINPRM